MTRNGGPSRFARAEGLFVAALERALDERDTFVRAACADDAVLYAEVASLLAAHARSGPVDRLAAAVDPLVAVVRAAEATNDSTLEGRTIGPYRVLGRVGGGGMGVVYRALDTRLHRSVAIKVLQPHLGSDLRAAERFRLEARAAGTLEHPNVCTVHEIGETDDGTLYLVMTLYEGETLQQRIERGPLPVANAVDVAAQVLRGLAKAHGRGIVHRDIKPSNVFLTTDGVVKVLDFGIAKLVDVTITGTSPTPGTLAYMSPEAITGQPVDERSDLYSVGILLHEALTGRRPYPHAMEAVRAAKDGKSQVTLDAMRQDMPAAVARVVARAIVPEPERRFQSASEFEEALRTLELPRERTAHDGADRWDRRRRFAMAGIAAGVLVAVGAAVWLGGRDARPGDEAGAVGASAPATIAVLPFVDRSPSVGQEHFADGMTEELTSTLSRVGGLRVASSTSAYAAHTAAQDVREIGRRLGVAAVVEGTVRSTGQRLRISARLVNTADGLQIWGETYDRAAGDAFAIQDDIARSIAQVLQVRLVGSAGAPRSAPPHPEAYELYLRGQAARLKSRFDRTGSTAVGPMAQIRFYEQAIARDSTFVAPYVEMAIQLLTMGFTELLSPEEAFPRAEEVARRALAVKPTHGEAHNIVAYVELYHRYDLARAEESFRRAVAAAPRSAVSHQWYANLLTIRGRFPEAVASMRRAQAADSTSAMAIAVEGWVQYYARQYAAALPAFARAIDRSPEYALFNLWRGWTLEAMDSMPSAIASLRRGVELSDSGGVYLAALAHALARAGDKSGAESLLRQLDARRSAGLHVPPYEIAKVHAALGRRDEAFAWLERAYTRRSHALVLMRVDPQLDPLRDDRRYAALERRVYQGQ